MFTEKIYPSSITKSELDYYLSKGWYRMGQGIFTCHFLCFGERIFSSIWLRLNLKQHQFSKSQRRLFRKNQHFRVEFGSFRIDREKEALYQKYRWYCFKGNISISLEDSLLDGGAKNIYQSLECKIYNGEKLIAASCFDVGENSVSSILGMYDPDYAAYSLGYFTMLLEIRYALENGYDYYYPGYVVPGYSRFDYKARIGKVDFYNVGNDIWLPFTELTAAQYPLERLIHHLELLKNCLEQYDISSQIYFYPLFETHLITYWDETYLKYPVFLWCQTRDGSEDYLFVAYDLNLKSYIILRCGLFSDLPAFLEELFEEENTDQPCFLEVLVVKHQIVADYPTDRIAKSLMQMSKLRRIK